MSLPLPLGADKVLFLNNIRPYLKDLKTHTFSKYFIGITVPGVSSVYYILENDQSEYSLRCVGYMTSPVKIPTPPVQMFPPVLGANYPKNTILLPLAATLGFTGSIIGTVIGMGPIVQTLVELFNSTIDYLPPPLLEEAVDAIPEVIPIDIKTNPTVEIGVHDIDLYKFVKDIELSDSSPLGGALPELPFMSINGFFKNTLNMVKSEVSKFNVNQFTQNLVPGGAGPPVYPSYNEYYNRRIKVVKLSTINLESKQQVIAEKLTALASQIIAEELRS